MQSSVDHRRRKAGAVRRLASGVMSAVLGFCILACSKPPALIGVDNPDIPVAAVEEATLQRIFIASTRQASEEFGELYSGARSTDLGLASVDVSIPPTHQAGKLERPKQLPPDPRTEFAAVNPVVYASDQAFINALNTAIRDVPRGKRDVLFFVHGYNNTTSDAVLRLAQFVEDSGFEGVPVLFDWASAGQLKRYVYDLNSALIARSQLAEIGAILASTNAEGYDIFAHSMGGFLTMEALSSAAQTGRLNYSGRLKNVILASPDVDLDLFRSHMATLNKADLELFVLLSKDDGALRISKALAGGVSRVGAADAQTLAELGVIAIDLTEIGDSSSGSHSKFAGSPEIVQLLGEGLNQHNRFDRSTRPSNLGEILAGIPVTVALD